MDFIFELGELYKTLMQKYQYIFLVLQNKLLFPDVFWYVSEMTSEAPFDKAEEIKSLPSLS